MSELKLLQVGTCTQETQILSDLEVPGVRVLYIHLAEHQTRTFKSVNAKIIFIMKGVIRVRTGGQSFILEELDTFVSNPQNELALSAAGEAELLLLTIQLDLNELETLRKRTDLPYTVSYDAAAQYTEDCKSEKTISRMLVPARTIPNFAGGSVSVVGPDRVEAHRHPEVEQFFFALKGNNCTVLIDGREYHFAERTFLHIPRGSLHGVSANKEENIHYLWMDFIFDEDGLEYMDTAHHLKNNP